MFDLERFIGDCRAAVAADPSHKAVREVVARAVSAPGEVMRAIGTRSASATPLRSGATSSTRSPIPIPRLTGAVHVYGGDFFDVPHRSQWEPDTLREGRYDMTRTMRLFEEANGWAVK